MVHDIWAFKRAKKRLKVLEPHSKKLKEFSDYLFNNLDLSPEFDIINAIECRVVEYFIEMNECRRIINSGASKEAYIQLQLIKKGETDEKN